MLLLNREDLKVVGLALLIIGGVFMLASSAQAQAALTLPPLPFPLTDGSCTCVSDPPTEAATAATAASVTTSGGAGLFQGQAPFLDAMMRTLANGIPDASTYAAYFQGWVDFGPNAAAIAASIANAIVQTDMNSLTVYQSLGQDFDTEDTALAAIEACNQAAGQSQSVLYALQCLTEAVVNNSQHVQLLEVAQLVRGINEVVHRGYEFNTDAQSGANLQTWLTQASQD